MKTYRITSTNSTNLTSKKCKQRLLLDMGKTDDELEAVFHSS